MRQMLGLLFIVTVVFLVTSYDDVIAPYWEVRITKALALVEEGNYREAVETLFDEDVDAPDQSSSEAQAASLPNEASSTDEPEPEAP